MNKSAPKARPRTITLSEYSQSLHDLTIKAWPALTPHLGQLEKELAQFIKENFGTSIVSSKTLFNFLDRVYSRQVFNLVYCYKAAQAFELDVGQVVTPLISASAVYFNRTSSEEYYAVMPEAFQKELFTQISSYFNQVLADAASQTQRWRLVRKTLCILEMIHESVERCIKSAKVFDESYVGASISNYAFLGTDALGYSEANHYWVNTNTYPFEKSIEELVSNPPETVPSFEGVTLTYNPNFKEMLIEFFEKARPVPNTPTVEADTTSDSGYAESCTRIRQALADGIKAISDDSDADVDANDNIRAQVLIVLYYLKKATKKPVLKTEKSVKKFNERLYKLWNVKFNEPSNRKLKTLDKVNPWEITNKKLSEIFKGDVEFLARIAHNPVNWNEAEGIMAEDFLTMGAISLLEWLSAQ